MKSMLSNQNEAKDHLKCWKVGALFMEAGTGKTRVALEIVNQSPCDSVVWVGPLRTLDNTKAEVDKWGGFKIPTTYYGIESIQSSDRIYLDLLDNIKKSNKPFVVVDESLKIKNYEAKRTKRMLTVGQMVEYKLILNGTPMSRNLMDMWAQMQFLSPLILNMTHSQFKNTFCEYTTIKKKVGWKTYTKEFITGFANVDYLYSLIRHYVYQCDLSLNVTQNYHTYNYCLTDEELETYNEIKNDFLQYDTLELWRNNIFLAMTQKMQHSYCCSPDKIAVVRKIFETVPQEKTLIFCKYIDSRILCEKEFPKAKVLSYQKESFGLNLQEYNHTIYFDKIWDYALITQSSRRTFRTGQEYDCQYYDITGNVGLERLIDRNIEKKISITEYFKRATKEDLKKDF